MPEIEIDESQRQYLEALRSQIAEEHIGDYGYVRMRDALQYLIDQHEASDAAFATAAGSESAVSSEASAPDESADTDEDESTAARSEETSAETQSDDAGSRLQRMMGLLDRHDDKWEETNSEEGKYTVTLPDGTTETARTKDDIRALLFKHYD